MALVLFFIPYVANTIKAPAFCYTSPVLWIDVPHSAKELVSSFCLALGSSQKQQLKMKVLLSTALCVVLMCYTAEACSTLARLKVGILAF